MTIPRYIALCGWPKSGKDEVALSLQKHHNVVRVDDGLCLRLACRDLFGCSPDDPFSQAGKARVYDTIKGPQEVRWMLGELGNALEHHFGEGFMPYNAMRHAETLAGLNPEYRHFVFPSVRKSQPLFYKEKGALVIEVRRPGIGDSGNDFDKWDATHVDVVVHNDSTLEALDRAVQDTFWKLEHFGEVEREVMASNFA